MRSANAKHCSSIPSTALNARSSSRTNISLPPASPIAWPSACGKGQGSRSSSLHPGMPIPGSKQQTMRAGLGRFMRVFEDAGVKRSAWPCSIRRSAKADRIGRGHDPFQDDDRRRHIVAGRIGEPEQPLVRVSIPNATWPSRPSHRSSAGPSVRVRDRMLGHFCGVGAKEVSASLARTGSLIATARSLRNDGHSLEPIDLDGTEPGSMSVLESVADPGRTDRPPLFLQTFVGRATAGANVAPYSQDHGVGIVIVALMLAWRFTALSALAHPDTSANGSATSQRCPAPR